MASPLNQDLLRLIFSYVFDVETLHHLLFSFSIDSAGFILALQRRLQFPILLTVGSPAYTSKLYNILCSHPETTIFVQNFIFAGGPSPGTTDRGSQLMLSEEQSKALDELRPAYPLDLSNESAVDWIQIVHARIFAAQKLSLGLPKLFGVTSSLRHLTWKLWPPPSTAVLDSMAGLSNLTSLSLECASSNWLKKHFDWLDTQERKDQYLDIEYLLKSIGFQLQHLDLRQVNETAYKQLIPNFHHLTALIDLSIDINCSWDWDGGGSPQPGVSNKYQFEKIEFVSDIQHVSIDTSDLALGSLTGGPLKMLEGSSLSRLTVRFKSCFDWIRLCAIRVFNNVDIALSMPNLTHLDVYEDDNFWLSKGRKRGPLDENDHDDDLNLERPRYCVSFHQFITALPRLDTLWCTEYLLLPLKTVDDPDSWKGIASVCSQDETWATSDWISIQPTLKRLVSLRAGLGPLTPTALRCILNSCDPLRLTQIGFEWSEDLGGESSISPDVLSMLKAFPALRDIHLLYMPLLPLTHDELSKRGYDQRTERSLFNNFIAPIISQVPSLTRVGIGKQCVWERSVPGPGIELIHEGDPSIRNGTFFDAGWEPLQPRDGSTPPEGFYVQVKPDEGIPLVKILEISSGDQRSDDLAEITTREHKMNYTLPVPVIREDDESDGSDEE